MVGNVLKNDAEGIGLFRSEFLYLESNDYPSEDVQFAANKDVLSKMVNKRVIVRTLDIGADKQVVTLICRKKKIRLWVFVQ